MNLYLCVSETIHDFGSNLDPPEDYIIADLVVARNRSQARYLSWKNEDGTNALMEIPKYQTLIKARNIDAEPKVITDYWKEFCKKNNIPLKALWNIN